MRLALQFILTFIFVVSLKVNANDLLEMESSATAIPQAQPSSIPTNNNPSLVLQAPLTNERNAIITATEYSDASTEQISKLLADPQIRNADILLSTDQESVVKTVIESTSKPQDRRLLRIIPIGKLAGVSEKIASGFQRYARNVKRTLMSDRIGLTVLAITVGNDSMIWMHSASLDIHQKTAMVMMNLVMAATFGLDRDLWGNINRPIKNKLIDVFNRFIPTEKANMFKTLSSQYISNMFLGMGVQLVRTGLLSLDHINTVVTSGSYWLTAAKLSALVTLTTFAWSELYSNVDSARDPVAKTMLKRLGEMRGIIMCQLASVSMVLQPHIYGSTPIYTYIIHGTIGLLALANAHRIVAWLERNQTIKKIYKKVETFEKFINSGFDNLKNPGAVRTCRSLFA